ncbi:hypothetical protein MTO96_024105 [Rhipicephalus appendiculatus]
MRPATPGCCADLCRPRFLSSILAASTVEGYTQLATPRVLAGRGMQRRVTTLMAASSTPLSRGVVTAAVGEESCEVHCCCCQDQPARDQHRGSRPAAPISCADPSWHQRASPGFGEREPVKERAPYAEAHPTTAALRMLETRTADKQRKHDPLSQIAQDGRQRRPATSPPSPAPEKPDYFMLSREAQAQPRAAPSERHQR